MNALGQRVRKASPLGDTVFHYDGQGKLIAESSPTGAPIREYVYLADQPVAVAAYSQAGGSCPANPTLDTSNSFTAFNSLERLEVRSGRLGAADWEWGLGNNTQAAGQFVTAGVNWENNKPYDFTLAYDGAGSATVTVRDGGTTLFTRTWASGMDAGNALKLYVKSTAGIPAGNLISLTVSSIDGQPVTQTLQTAGTGAFSEQQAIYAGTSLANGFTVEGTVRLSFTGSYPPTGSRLNMMVTAGNVTCQGSGPQQATLYYVHSDHLNTPRVVTDSQQRVVWRWENFEPFGNSPPEENPSGLGNFEFPLRFPGQYFDPETNTAQNYHRDYDSLTGRYVQSDPIGLAGGINTYAYSSNQPTRYTDPNGLQAVPAPGPVPIPLPPVFIPGTPENQRFVDTISRIIRKIGDMCTPSESDREKECREQLEREEKLCVAIAGSRYGGDKATAIRICQSAAMRRYAACLRGTPPEDRPPLTGVDTPI